MALKPIKDILELLLALWTFVSDRLIFLWSYVSALTYFAIIIIAIVVLAIVVILAIPFAPTIVVAAMIVIQWFVAFVAIAFIVCVFVVLACVALAFFIIWRMFVVLRMVLNAFWTLLLHYLSFRQRGVQRGMPRVPIHGSFDVADACCGPVQAPTLLTINRLGMVGMSRRARRLHSSSRTGRGT